MRWGRGEPEEEEEITVPSVCSTLLASAITLKALWPSVLTSAKPPLLDEALVGRLRGLTVGCLMQASLLVGAGVAEVGETLSALPCSIRQHSKNGFEPYQVLVLWLVTGSAQVLRICCLSMDNKMQLRTQAVRAIHDRGSKQFGQGTYNLIYHNLSENMV